MLARRLTLILPVMTLAEAIDTTRIRSIAQVEDLLFESAVEVDTS
jgi:predicted ATPase with chaperone activity